MARYFTCREDVGDIGERPRRLCLAPTAEDSDYCSAHLARRRARPIWPTGAEPTPGQEVGGL